MYMCMCVYMFKGFGARVVCVASHYVGAISRAGMRFSPGMSRSTRPQTPKASSSWPSFCPSTSILLGSSEASILNPEP